MSDNDIHSTDQVTEAQARQIDALAGALPKSVTPPADLWSGIEVNLNAPTAIEAPGTHNRGNWWQAAAAILLVGVTATITTLVIREPQPETGETAAASSAVSELPAPSTGQAPAATGPRNGQGNGESTVYWPRGLSGGIGSAEYLAVNTLPDDTRKTFLDNLAEIQSARRAVEAALEEDPNNMWLRELWLHAYEQEMELLDDTSRVAHDMSGRLRT